MEIGLAVGPDAVDHARMAGATGKRTRPYVVENHGWHSGVLPRRRRCVRATHPEETDE